MRLHNRGSFLTIKPVIVAGRTGVNHEQSRKTKAYRSHHSSANGRDPMVQDVELGLFSGYRSL